MNKIIQISVIQATESQPYDIVGLGSDGVVYYLDKSAKWEKLTNGLESIEKPAKKVAPKLTYAKYEEDDHVELRVDGERIATWETGVDSTAEDQFKEFKRIFMAGYNAITTLDKG